MCVITFHFEFSIESPYWRFAFTYVVNVKVPQPWHSPDWLKLALTIWQRCQRYHDWKLILHNTCTLHTSQLRLCLPCVFGSNTMFRYLDCCFLFLHCNRLLPTNLMTSGEAYRYPASQICCGRLVLTTLRSDHVAMYRQCRGLFHQSRLNISCCGIYRCHTLRFHRTRSHYMMCREIHEFTDSRHSDWHVTSDWSVARDNTVGGHSNKMLWPDCDLFHTQYICWHLVIHRVIPCICFQRIAHKSEHNHNHAHSSSCWH